MEKIYESVKIDQALAPVSLASTNSTGDYFELKDYRQACFILETGALAATKTAVLQIMEATDAAGTSAAAITTGVATITANTSVNEATITLATVLNTESIVINGLTFTAHTDTTTLASRQFAIDGTDTADAAALVTCINDPTYGVPGITASSSSGVVTLKSTDRGATALTVSSSDSTFTIATTKAQAYVDLDHFALSNGFSHVAAKVTTDATIVCGAVLLRGQARESFDQATADSAAI